MARRVLVADDDLVTRKMLHKILSDAGYWVLLASDGLRAKTALEDNPDVDLLITDVLMPGLDGRELVRALRQDQRFGTLPVIIMSAAVSVREITHLLELGASRFLAKPVNSSVLQRELDAIFA